MGLSGTATLDNTTINLGSNAAGYGPYGSSIINSGGGVVTLGANTTINHAEPNLNICPGSQVTNALTTSKQNTMRPSHTWRDDLVRIFFKLKIVHELTAYNGAIYISDVGSQINHTTHSGYLGSELLSTRKSHGRAAKKSRALKTSFVPSL